MKKIILLFTIALSLNSWAQKDTAVFEDGTKIAYELLYDDPYHLPKWEVNVNPLTIVDAGSSAPALVFQIIPSYVLNSKMYIDFQLTLPYSKAMHGEKEDEISKLFIDFTPLFHYKLFNYTSHKDRGLTLKNESNVAYKIEKIRNFGRSVYIDGGLNFFQSSSNKYLSDVNDDEMNKYFIGSHNGSSFTTGLTYTKTESTKLIVDGKTKTNWNRLKWYANFNFLVSDTKDIYKIGVDETVDPSLSHKLEEFDDIIILSKLNYRVGFNATIGMKKNMPLNLGFEFGSIPAYQNKNNVRLTQKTMVMFHVGFGIIEKL